MEKSAGAFFFRVLGVRRLEFLVFSPGRRLPGIIHLPYVSRGDGFLYNFFFSLQEIAERSRKGQGR